VLLIEGPVILKPGLVIVSPQVAQKREHLA
jgi:hypothetical protein